MLDRRQFTFATLVALISPSAAAEPTLRQQAMVPATPSLVPTYVVKRKGNELQIDLSFRNAGTEPVDLLVARGSRPGALLTAALADGAALEEIVEVGRRDLMSRIGPLPQYAPVAAGASVNVGTYRFSWLASRPDPVLDVAVEVYTAAGPVAVPVQRLSTARTGT